MHVKTPTVGPIGKQNQTDEAEILFHKVIAANL
jgi:hypothetical protein